MFLSPGMPILSRASGGGGSSTSISNGGGSVTVNADGSITLAPAAGKQVFQRNGANGQVWFMYNTFTDASNGEWLQFGWDGANNRVIIKTSNNGTGILRGIHILGGGGNGLGVGLTDPALDNWSLNGGNFLCTSDSSGDIGSSGANRPRNVFVASSLVSKVKAGTPTDADVTNAADGMMVLDSTNSKVWVRLGGAWKGVVVA
jgi:hypothetical protein